MRAEGRSESLPTAMVCAPDSYARDTGQIVTVVTVPVRVSRSTLSAVVAHSSSKQGDNMASSRMSPAELGAHLGQEIGVSSWITVDQQRINEFAHCTEDHQWMGSSTLPLRMATSMPSSIKSARASLNTNSSRTEYS